MIHQAKYRKKSNIFHKGPTIFLIEPSYHGYEYVEAAKRLGVEAIVIRRENGPPNPDPSYSVEINVDVREPSQVVAAVKRHLSKIGSNGPFGILPGNEYCVHTAAFVASYFGLIGNTFKSALVCRDKAFMRAHFSTSTSIRQPMSFLCYTIQEVHDAAKQIGFPIIAKPPDMAASWYVKKIDNIEELCFFFKKVIGRINMIDYPSIPSMLVEEYIIGPEFSVELLIDEKDLLYGMVTEKEKGPLPEFVEIGHTIPASNVTKTEEETLIQTAQMVANEAGLKKGPVHVELIINGGAPVLVEVAARLAGDHITDLIRIATGIVPHEAAIQQALQMDVIFPKKNINNKAASIQYLLHKVGFYLEPKLMQKIKKFPGVMTVHFDDVLARGSGDPINSNTPRLGYVIAKGASNDEAKAKAKNAVKAMTSALQPISGG
jgi:biotin carboxylase